jgi:hypothetical protein
MANEASREIMLRLTTGESSSLIDSIFEALGNNNEGDPRLLCWYCCVFSHCASSPSRVWWSRAVVAAERCPIRSFIKAEERRRSISLMDWARNTWRWVKCGVDTCQYYGIKDRSSEVSRITSSLEKFKSLPPKCWAPWSSRVWMDYLVKVVWWVCFACA